MAAEAAALVAHQEHCSQNDGGTIATCQEKKNCAGPYYPTDNHSIQMIVRLLPDLVQNLGQDTLRHGEGLSRTSKNAVPDEELHPKEYEHCFVDLGSGDGRVVREMWNRFGRGKHPSSSSSFRAIGVEYDRKVLEKNCGLVFEEKAGTLRDTIEDERDTRKDLEEDDVEENREVEHAQCHRILVSSTASGRVGPSDAALREPGPQKQDCCQRSALAKMKNKQYHRGPEFLCSDFFLLFEEDTTMVAPPEESPEDYTTTGTEVEVEKQHEGHKNWNCIYASPTLASELRADINHVDADAVDEDNRTSATRTEKSTTIYCRTKLRRFLKQNATIVFLYLLPEFHNMLSNKLIPMLLDENSKLELIIAWWWPLEVSGADLGLVDVQRHWIGHKAEPLADEEDEQVEGRGARDQKEDSGTVYVYTRRRRIRGARKQKQLNIRRPPAVPGVESVQHLGVEEVFEENLRPPDERPSSSGSSLYWDPDGGIM
ncbi:unnamed protein product [Amoebophrya sp. A120]|nr:unnamed protein product [Amoebophrya sp. A120]|eukprot:GSA120T00004457001.1